MLGYCYIADAEWGAWSPTQTTPRMWRSVKVDGIEARPTVLSTGN